MRALIADDDPVATAVLSRALRKWNLDPIVAHDGMAAWDAVIGADAPRLAIVDWMMPRLDGVDLCRRIRTTPSSENMYVILLTSRDQPEDVVAGLDAGADDYLVKPFRAGELRARINAGVRVLQLQERLTERLGDLERALASVKQLRGLLPICSYCKRIRSDENYWHQVESYISHRTDAEFSHGVCPACYEKVQAEFFGDD